MRSACLTDVYGPWRAVVQPTDEWLWLQRMHQTWHLLGSLKLGRIACLCLSCKHQGADQPAVHRLSYHVFAVWATIWWASVTHPSLLLTALAKCNQAGLRVILFMKQGVGSLSHWPHRDWMQTKSEQVGTNGSHARCCDTANGKSSKSPE